MHSPNNKSVIEIKKIPIVLGAEVSFYGAVH